jgi:hypothetical protein
MATLASYHRQTLVAIFARPTSGTIKWREIEKLFEALGASIEERKGSRICVSLNGKDAFFTGRTLRRTLTGERLRP